MFGYDAVRTVDVVVADPAADATVNIWRVPSRMAKCEILEAWAQLDTAIAGTGTTITLTLLDMGTAGTAPAGTVTALLGGTATGDWTANTPRAFTISEGTLEASHYLAVAYDETGTVAPKNITIGLSWAPGVAA